MFIQKLLLGVILMNILDSAEFRFESKTVKLPKLERNLTSTFLIPVPLSSKNANIETHLDSTHLDNFDSTLIKNQHSVNVRQPFKNIIERNIEHIEKLFDVRMSLQQVEDDYKLISSGLKAESSINEILNICRKSNVYNFYLCFPVRGDEFHTKLAEFKKNVQYKLGSSVSFEKRPHITLALVNLVTDSDIDLVVRALQLTSLAIKSLPKNSSDFDQYSIDLEGLDVVKYKGKFAKRSVLMSNVTLSETLADIATEFQNSVNRSVNTLLNNQSKRKRISKSDRVSNLTEAQLAPKGIFITRGGNIEMTFTDVPLVDPKASKSHKHADSNTADGSKSTEMAENSSSGLEEGLKGDEGFENGSDEPKDQRADESIEQANESEDEDEVFDFDTSVKNKFHVTLMRHQQVSLLSSLKFASRGHVVCVELRPRNGECCSFTAYSNNELVSFVGNRFDNKQNDDIATTQIAGSQPPDIPNHLLVDMETEHMNWGDERFVFWI